MIKVPFSFGSEPMYVSDVWSPNLDLLDTQIGSCKYKNALLTGRLEQKISKIGRLEPARSLKTWGLHIINVCSIKAGKMLSQVSKMGTSLFRPKASWISNALTPNTTLKCQRSKMAFYLEFASKTDIFYQKVLFGLYVWLLLPLRCV